MDDDRERPGLGWLGPDEHLEPSDFTPVRRAEGWVGGSLALTDDLLQPHFRADDELPIPVTAPPAPVPDADAATGELPIVRRRRFPLRTGLLVALVLLAGTGVALAVVDAGNGSEDLAVPGLGPAEKSGRVPQRVSAPLGGRTSAGFDLLDGTATVNLHTAAMGEDLYRISTPDGSDVAPRADTQGDRVRLSLVPTGFTGAGAVDITLNSDVRWDLRLAGGSNLSVVDLGGGEVAGIELNGGASRIDLTLPRPDGTLTVRMTGGVSEFLVHTAGQVPVRVRVGSGAGQVVLDGRSHNGVAAGELFTPSRWDDGGDRIDLDAVAGMSALKVD